MLAVLVFAAVGQSSHAEVVDTFGVLTTAVPFLLGLLVGWLAVRAWRAPLRLPVGVAVLAASWLSVSAYAWRSPTGCR